MGKKETEKLSKEFLGLDAEHFKCAVDVIVTLRDSGKLLVFTGRQKPVRIIVEAECFRGAYASARAKEDIELAEASAAIEEVTLYLQLLNSYSKPSAVVSFMEGVRFEKQFAESDDQGKESLRELLQEKADIVSAKLFDEALRERSRRIASATVPCLEDLDVEVVQTRKDDYSSQTLDTPFLRLRVRYSHNKEPAFPFQLLRSADPSVTLDLPAESFELECDLCDIDLLLVRLNAARRRFMAAQLREEEK
ncbi:MAG: hypothetical protein JSU63_00485 [Phycisphaerales bacterium]|nr:MAG: hypothetical protein JSU63_00485 [Phycisphaerales bacterium]